MDRRRDRVESCKTVMAAPITVSRRASIASPSALAPPHAPEGRQRHVPADRTPRRTHSIAEAASHARPINQPRLSSTPKSQTSSISSSTPTPAFWPTPIPSSPSTVPTCFPPAHAPRSLRHLSAAESSVAERWENELEEIVGRPAISRQSRTWETVDGPPE